MNVLIVLMIAVLFILVPLTVWFAIMSLSILSSAPWVPTDRHVARKMCEIANIKEGDHVLDLGCGDASILIVAGKEFGATCVGVELNPAVVLLARVRVRLAKLQDRVQIIRGNMYSVPLPDVDIAMLYLLPKGTKKVEDRLKERFKHLKVVSHGFQLSSPERSNEQVEGPGKATVRLYEW